MLAVTSDDIVTELGRALTDVEKHQADKWLAAAQAIIRKRLGDLERLDQDLLAYVVVQMVAERFRHPADGATSVQVSVDDATSVRRFGDSAAGLLFRPEWVDLLTPDEDLSQAFTIRPVGHRGGCHAW